MTALRWVAVAIAVLAVIDPRVRMQRPVRPVVAVVPADARSDAEQANQVAEALARDFTIVRSAFSGAEGAVIVGTTLPPDVARARMPVFAVQHDAARSGVVIERIAHPRVAPADGRVSLGVTLRASGTGQRTADVELRNGTLVVGRAVVAFAPDSGRAHVALSYAPSSFGPALLRVTARVRGAPGVASADVVIDARDSRWNVLFADQRPSWMSTFVRRAVERDPRFIVSSRIATSRGVATESGTPAALDGGAGLDVFDVIVVGAPEQLSQAAADGLERYLRRRAGTVVLLVDTPVERGSAIARLARSAEWRIARTASPVRVAAGSDSVFLRASTLSFPVSLPPVADVMAADTGDRPIIWKVPVGAGTLVVSGAADAWHARDSALSSFDDYWPSIIADAAHAAMPALDIQVAQDVVRPGERIDLVVQMRDAILGVDSGTALPTGTLAGDMLRFWPNGSAGEFSARVRAPVTPGLHALEVRAGGASSRSVIAVDTVPSRPAPDDRDAVAAWVRTRGGSAFDASEARELRAALLASLRPERRLVTVRPMRSPWWIVPFSLLLGAEWWWRRRRGMA